MTRGAQRNAHFFRGATLLALVAVSVPAAADEPTRVEFDLGHTVACTEVTPPEFAALHPEEKVVALTFRVSVRVTSGTAADIDELLFEITSPAQRLRVLDFAPDTQLESETAGEIEISKTEETLHSAGTALDGKVFLPAGPASAHLSPTANLGTTRRKLVVETRKKVPPKRVVLTSGTMHQGHGVFFKLRPSLNGSLEGAHEFACRVIVPQDWSGDWVAVTCQARGETTRYFMTSDAVFGQTTAFVGLYLAGEADAKQAAFRLAHAQGEPGSAVNRAERSAWHAFSAAAHDWLLGELHTARRPSQATTRLDDARQALARHAGRKTSALR